MYLQKKGFSVKPKRENEVLALMFIRLKKIQQT